MVPADGGGAVTRLTANYFQVGVREKLSRFRVVGSTEQTIFCLDGWVIRFEQKTCSATMVAVVIA